ncbi:hypothetical protein [Terriglobus albidus]|nr:hypothetical protein [Terriglobus albidus]
MRFTKADRCSKDIKALKALHKAQPVRAAGANALLKGTASAVPY